MSQGWIVAATALLFGCQSPAKVTPASLSTTPFRMTAGKGLLWFPLAVTLRLGTSKSGQSLQLREVKLVLSSASNQTVAEIPLEHAGGGQSIQLEGASKSVTVYSPKLTTLSPGAMKVTGLRALLWDPQGSGKLQALQVPFPPAGESREVAFDVVSGKTTAIFRGLWQVTFDWMGGQLVSKSTLEVVDGSRVPVPVVVADVQAELGTGVAVSVLGLKGSGGPSLRRSLDSPSPGGGVPLGLVIDMPCAPGLGLKLVWKRMGEDGDWVTWWKPSLPSPCKGSHRDALQLAFPRGQWTLSATQVVPEDTAPGAGPLPGEVRERLGLTPGNAPLLQSPGETPLGFVLHMDLTQVPPAGLGYFGHVELRGGGAKAFDLVLRREYSRAALGALFGQVPYNVFTGEPLQRDRTKGSVAVTVRAAGAPAGSLEEIKRAVAASLGVCVREREGEDPLLSTAGAVAFRVSKGEQSLNLLRPTAREQSSSGRKLAECLGRGWLGIRLRVPASRGFDGQIEYETP